MLAKLLPQIKNKLQCKMLLIIDNHLFMQFKKTLKHPLSPICGISEKKLNISLSLISEKTHFITQIVRHGKNDDYITKMHGK